MIEVSEVPISIVDQHQAKENKNDEFKVSDWPLNDVLRSTNEQESAKLLVFTPSEKVDTGEMRVEIGPGINTLEFGTYSNLIDKKLAEDLDFIYDKSINEHGDLIETYDNKYTNIRIHSKAGEEKKEIEVNSKVRSDMADDLNDLGLKDIMTNHSLPDKTSPEFAQQLINEAEIKVGRRKIPVEMVSDNRELRNVFGQTPEGVFDVFHGTSLADALDISRIGLFTEGSSVNRRPILSGIPDGVSAKLARDEWDGYPKTDLSGYGAILLFRTNPQDIILSADANENGEKFFHPSKRISESERLRLQSSTKKELPVNNPRYLSPDNIEKIILVKQTSRAT